VSDGGDIDRHIATLLRPSGDAGANVMRREALDALLEQADEAHPRLLALAASDPPPLLALKALPEFGRPESVPVLERVLHSAPGPTTAVAAAALAEHPAEEAFAALEGGLADARKQVVLSALMGLRERGDARACGALRAVAEEHSDAEVRERAAVAAAQLGCG
jgi:HEAT repeat protein